MAVEKIGPGRFRCDCGHEWFREVVQLHDPLRDVRIPYCPECEATACDAAEAGEAQLGALGSTSELVWRGLTVAAQLNAVANELRQLDHDGREDDQRAVDIRRALRSIVDAGRSANLHELATGVTPESIRRAFATIDVDRLTRLLAKAHRGVPKGSEDQGRKERTWLEQRLAKEPTLDEEQRRDAVDGLLSLRTEHGKRGRAYATLALELVAKWTDIGPKALRDARTAARKSPSEKE